MAASLVFFAAAGIVGAAYSFMADARELTLAGLALTAVCTVLAVPLTDLPATSIIVVMVFALGVAAVLALQWAKAQGLSPELVDD